MIADFFALPRFAKKSLQKVEALTTHDAGYYFAAVVERRVGIQQIDPAASRASLRIGAAKNHTLGPAMDNRAGTHRAWLLGYIKRTLFQPPIAKALLRSSERKHLGMRGGVLKRLDLIPCTGNDAPLVGDHRANWHLAGRAGLVRLAQRLTHEIGVAVEINDRCFVNHARRLAHHRLQCTRIAPKHAVKNTRADRVVLAMVEFPSWGKFLSRAGLHLRRGFIMKHHNNKRDRKHSPSWMVFSATLGLTLMPCAAQNESMMPHRMKERSKQMQENMSQHFHRAWTGMRDAMRGHKGAGKPLADASMDLREQSDSYVLRLHFPDRDINLVEAGLSDGRNLHVTAPASGTLGAYEQNIILEEVAPGAKPELEKQPDSGLVIIRVSKTPSDKKPAPEANSMPGKELPAASDPWDVRMIEHMKRMGQDMDDMLHENADDMMDHPNAKHWLDRSSFNSAYDLQEEEGRYVVRAYLPERSAEQVKVSVREQNLIIEAVAEKTSGMDAGKDGKATMRHMRQYAQSIALPGPVDGDHIEIERKEGLLLIRIPKTTGSEPASEKPSGK